MEQLCVQVELHTGMVKKLLATLTAKKGAKWAWVHEPVAWEASFDRSSMHRRREHTADEVH